MVNFYNMTKNPKKNGDFYQHHIPTSSPCCPFLSMLCCVRLPGQDKLETRIRNELRATKSISCSQRDGGYPKMVGGKGRG